VSAPEVYDLVVIGAGPAGEKGAAQAAYFGKRVAMVETAPHPGGAGVNTGTVPSKALRASALYFSGLRQRGLFGRDYDLSAGLTMRDVLHREQEAVEALREVVRQNLDRHQIDVVRGHGAFEDAHTVLVTPSDGGAPRRLRGDVVLLAPGSLPNPGRGDLPQGPRVYDSDSVLRMDALPTSLGIIGAGVIGCEYASIFSALGINVTVIDGRDRLLPFLDGEISDRLRVELERLGVGFWLQDGVTRVEVGSDGVALELQSGATVHVEAILIAAGRLGATRGLGLEKLGIAVGDRGHISVNDHYQTSVPHVYAAGDVLGLPGLAATAMEQARVAMCHAFDLGYKTRVASLVPLAVYTIPEVAMVGETEESARERGLDYCVGSAPFSRNARAQIVGEIGGVLKLIFRPADRALLGVHVLGEGASELVHVGLMVLHAGGAIDAFIDATFNYPTLGEAYKYAAYDGLGNLDRRRG
jgi:NAD(P) transhydrogenase